MKKIILLIIFLSIFKLYSLEYLKGIPVIQYNRIDDSISAIASTDTLRNKINVDLINFSKQKLPDFFLKNFECHKNIDFYNIELIDRNKVIIDEYEYFVGDFIISNKQSRKVGKCDVYTLFNVVYYIHFK